MRNPNIEEVEAKLHIALEQYEKRTPELLAAQRPGVMAARQALLLEWGLDVGDENLFAGMLVAVAKFTQMAAIQCNTGEISHQAHDRILNLANLFLSLREDWPEDPEVGGVREDPAAL